MLASLRRRGTDIELTLSQMSQQDLYARMLNGETDLALLVDDDDLPERLHRWKMFHERYLLVCPPGHRFGDRDRVPVRELAGESLLMHEDSLCQARRFLVRLLEQANIRPHRRHFANNLEQILEMARAALGVSVAGERAVAPPPLFRRGIETEDDARTVVLTAVAGRPLGPTPALFVRLMRAHAWNQPPTETAGEA
jgi:DNA-binding transcriptional LysR family regulator